MCVPRHSTTGYKDVAPGAWMGLVFSAVVCVGILAVVIQLQRNGKNNEAFRRTHLIAEPRCTFLVDIRFRSIIHLWQGGRRELRIGDCYLEVVGHYPYGVPLGGPFSLEWLFDPRTAGVKWRDLALSKRKWIELTGPTLTDGRITTVMISAGEENPTVWQALRSVGVKEELRNGQSPV